MRAIAKVTCAAFQVVILAIGAVTANSEPGDLFASIDGDPGNGVGSIYKYTPHGLQSTVATGLFRPRGLAFDSAGNLFVATNFCDATRWCHPTILKFTPDGTRSVFIGHEAFTNPETSPIGLAFDRFGNLFVSTAVFPYNGDGILRFSPQGVKNKFASGLPNPRGLIFDSTGKLFVAQIPPSAGGDILKFTRKGVPTVFSSEIGVPQENG